MEGSENPVAMCTRCHAKMEAPAKEEKESAIDRILTLFASAFLGITTRFVRALFGRNQA
jgi:hypothetical protein